MIHLAGLMKMACRDVETLTEIYFMNKPVYIRMIPAKGDMIIEV